MREIGRGAEAVVYHDKSCGKDGGKDRGKDSCKDPVLKRDCVLKRRSRKEYRLAVIDEGLRRRRTKAEAGILDNLGKKGILVPPIISWKEDEIIMGFIQGCLVKDVLEKDVAIAEAIGLLVASVHAEDIVHGDLTTSNMILGKKQEVWLIDFGLAYHSKRLEDKAVDLHLFLQALESRHYRVKEKAWSLFTKGYLTYALGKDVLARLGIVERRGRYKMKRGG